MNARYVDHPAPGAGFMALLFVALALLLVAVPELLRTETPRAARLVVFGTLAILAFYLWPLYSTYYTLMPSGLQVRYGPWKRTYSWSEFNTVFWQRGLFASRIGWPPMTPCVRLTDAVLLKRPGKPWGLYLTPNDSRAFLAKVTEFAPELTRETIL